MIAVFCAIQAIAVDAGIVERKHGDLGRFRKQYWMQSKLNGEFALLYKMQHTSPKFVLKYAYMCHGVCSVHLNRMQVAPFILLKDAFLLIWVKYHDVS